VLNGSPRPGGVESCRGEEFEISIYHLPPIQVDVDPGVASIRRSAALGD
jgi:hypothetical protein